MGGRGAGLHMRTPILGAPGGRASEGGGAEDETIGGRVVTGLTCIVMGFST